MKEVARLRTERKKLMDIGNELRSTLFQLQSKSGTPVGARSHEVLSSKTESAPNHHSATSPILNQNESIRMNPWREDELPPPPPGPERDDKAPSTLYPQHPSRDTTHFTAGHVTDRIYALEGEALAALPLPSSRHSTSNRATPSQQRVLQRLKQNQAKLNEPRKVVNYATAVGGDV